MSVRSPHEGVYTRIGRSRTHGVGVIAIRPIPRGTLVFGGESERVVWVSRAAWWGAIASACRRRSTLVGGLVREPLRPP
jgi:hypothetical protein